MYTHLQTHTYIYMCIYAHIYIYTHIFMYVERMSRESFSSDDMPAKPFNMLPQSKDTL